MVNQVSEEAKEFAGTDFIISGEIILAVIQTLAHRPYGEVTGLIQALTTLEKSGSEIIRP